MAIVSNNAGQSTGKTFTERFGGVTPPAQTTSRQNGAKNKEERPASKYWINVGIPVDYPLENGDTEVRLATLPLGIPLDSIQELPNNTSNEAYFNFTADRNDLLVEIQELAEKLQPGEAVQLNLVVELRRKFDDAPRIREGGRRKFGVLASED